MARVNAGVEIRGYVRVEICFDVCVQAGGSNAVLVYEVADLGKDAVAEFHAEKSRAERGAQALFKTFEDRSRQVRLLPKHLQQGSAIGWILVVAGQTACRADRERDGNGACRGIAPIGRLSDQVDSHSEILRLAGKSLNGTVG